MSSPQAAILSGYRQQLCYAGCVRSVFRLHNETVGVLSCLSHRKRELIDGELSVLPQVNIWTHLLGFLFFLGVLLDTCTRHQGYVRDGLDLAATCVQLLSYQVTTTTYNKNGQQ